ncbi:Peroxisomal membrane protein PMP34 [Trichoplax sp. H2]|nr:Peroxisomal membrane protein PMP34 [Trichoplax sp. H2]|eukprot:RDD39875.1 Peroxisomal membrane protein PMP34 [Trichoplax sp. H2]
MSSLLTFDALTHAIAGASGSAVAMSTFYPLDLARTRLQVDMQTKLVKPTHQILAKIIREEGLSALYTGFGPVLTSLYCSNFVYFYAFNGLRMLDVVKQLPLTQSVSDLVVGMVAGTINVFATTPLWVANTRLRLQGVTVRDYNNKVIKKTQYTGIFDCFRRIIKEEGILSLWSGLAPSLVLCCNPAIQFMSYEALKRYITRGKNNMQIPSWLVFLMGAISKAIATVLTYPLQVSQARLRHNTSEKANKKRTFITIMQEIIRHEGFSGLFKGLEAKLLQTVLTTALMFTMYEKIMSFVLFVTKASRKKASLSA